MNLIHPPPPSSQKACPLDLISESVVAQAHVAQVFACLCTCVCVCVSQWWAAFVHIPAKTAEVALHEGEFS